MLNLSNCFAEFGNNRSKRQGQESGIFTHSTLREGVSVAAAKQLAPIVLSTQNFLNPGRIRETRHYFDLWIL
jgi:hypothetical protein